MTRWLAISNRTNSDITVKKHLWGVPKRAINQISKTHPGDTLLVYVGQQVIDKDTTLPPAITGCFEITSEVYEDTKPVFTAPPKLGAEVFPPQDQTQDGPDLRPSGRVQAPDPAPGLHHQQKAMVRAHQGAGDARDPGGGSRLDNGAFTPLSEQMPYPPIFGLESIQLLIWV